MPTSPIWSQINDLLAMVEPGCGLSQFSTDLIEELTDVNDEIMLEKGLCQPHLTTHEGRLAVWGAASKITSMNDAVSFKEKADRDFWSKLGKLMSHWGSLLDGIYYADGPERPAAAVHPSVGKSGRPSKAGA